MKKFLWIFVCAALWMNACNAELQPAPPTVIPPTATRPPTQPAVSVESSPTAQSKINVEEAALRGVEIVVWTPWFGVEQSLFESFVKEFNAENPYGIIVQAQSQINFSYLYETTTAALPTEKKPNLVIALPEHAQSWHDQQAVAELNDYVADPRYGIDPSDIPAAFWEQDISGETRIGLPAQRAARVLLWNETWAQELNLPAAPLSAENFRKQVCAAHNAMKQDAFVENDAFGGWLADTNPMTAYSWLLAFGGGAFDNGAYRFLAPNNIEAFKYLRELSEAGCAWQGADDPIAAFVNRKALTISVALNQLPDVARAFVAAENRDEWSVSPFPNGGEGVIAIYGSSYVILKSSAEKQLAAWLFARWLLEKEQDARWAEATHNFPIRSSTLELLGDYEKTHPQWAQAVALIPLGAAQPQTGSWRTIKYILGDGFDSMYRLNISSGQVAAVLAQMDAFAKESR
ncbi:MAG: extracellular solute-binding protein [Anaerolineales bacterium]|nr:extracellular solute-binding protein [Anaerolineales bacterium]